MIHPHFLPDLKNLLVANLLGIMLWFTEQRWIAFEGHIEWILKVCVLIVSLILGLTSLIKKRKGKMPDDDVYDV
jgi:hypothetical protein